MKIPILSRCSPVASHADLKRATQLAEQVKLEQPKLDPANCQFFEHIVSSEIGDQPSLHLDDFSEIPVIGVGDNSHILQQRARLRAGNGDYVVQSRKIERGFSDYCEYDLGLGRVQWLYPAVLESDANEIAVECWQDRRLRHDLEQAIRHDGLRYIHPHISTFQVWELAALLQKSTRMPVSVIGPTPALAKWANDKIEFSKFASRLIGEDSVPHTECAYNFATLSKAISKLAATNNRLGIKFPYGTGGTGNFLIKSEKIRGRSLLQVRNYLTELLEAHKWPEGGRVLVDVWETEVINSPSVQTWIPPSGQGAPVIEGVFVQAVTGESGNFVGSCPAQLPSDIEQKIVNDSFLLASVFQQLGYVGRCSFDLILVGENMEDCRVEFIECNARWGGTSSPMTLMNRIGIAELSKTFCIRKIKIPEIWRVKFAELKRELADELYVPATGQGRFVLFNPARIKEHSSVEVIAIADSEREASEILNVEFTNRLGQMAQAAIDDCDSPTAFLMSHADFDEPEN